MKHEDAQICIDFKVLPQPFPKTEGKTKRLCVVDLICNFNISISHLEQGNYTFHTAFKSNIVFCAFISSVNSSLCPRGGL